MHNPAGSAMNPAAQKSKEEFISINREPQTNLAENSSENNYSPGPSKAKGGQRGYGRGGGSVVYGAPKATPTRSYNSVTASSSRCLIQSVLITHFKIVCLLFLFDLGFGQYCKISIGQKCYVNSPESCGFISTSMWNFKAKSLILNQDTTKEGSRREH